MQKFANIATQAVTLMMLQTGTDPIRGTPLKQFEEIITLNAHVLCLRTDMPQDNLSAVRSIFKITLMPSPFYAPDIQKGRYFRYEDIILKIGTIEKNRITGEVICMCYETPMVMSG